MRGLNASIVALGQHGTGKTYSLFGPGGPHSVEHVGLVPLLLDELARAADEHPGRFALGLSAWEIQGTEAVDLLATEGAGADDGRVEFPIVPGTWLEFTTVVSLRSQMGCRRCPVCLGAPACARPCKFAGHVARLLPPRRP